MTHLAAGVNEVQINLLEGNTLCLDQQGLPEADHPFLGSSTTTFDHDEVLVDLTIVGEATHWGDCLLSEVILRGSIILHHLSILCVDTLTNAVDLLVHLSAMMVALLTSSGNCELDTARMPGTNTSNLAQTLVSLAGQLLGVPTRGHALNSFSLCNTNNIHHLILIEDICNRNLLFKVGNCPINLVSDSSTIQLDFHNVSFLLPLLQNLDLGVCNDANSTAVLLHLGKIFLDNFLSHLVLPLLGCISEGLLL